MSASSLPCVLRLVLCAAVIGLALPRPMAFAAAPKTEEHDCCAHMKGAQSQHHDCDHQPTQSSSDEEQHCCAACALGLSLFLTPPATLIFSPERGERLVSSASMQQTRCEPPPVPPPRAIA